MLVKIPPRILSVILEQIVPFSDHESLAGDFAEIYHELVLSRGRLSANLWYLFQIIKLIPDFFSREISGSLIMLSNYLKISWRNIKRHRGYTFINVAGLSSGMACCIILFLFINYEISFNRYHEKEEQIYKLCMDGEIGGTKIRGSASNALAAGILKDRYEEVEDAARLLWNGGISGKYLDKKFNINRTYYADASVFNIFSWPLMQGDAETALIKPATIVIDQSTAYQIFGNKNPIGQILNNNDGQNFTITGVMRDVPKNSSLRLNALCSMETNYSGELSSMFTDWISFNFSTYLLLKQDVEYEVFEKKISGLLYEFAGDQLKAKGAREELFLHPLKDLYLRPVRGEGGPILYVYIFSAVAIFVLLIACVNFMNLATAKSQGRALEVGLRKTLGASRGNLIEQFLGESVILSFISLIFAVLLVQIILPEIRVLSNREIQFNLFDISWLLPGLIFLTLLVGVISGSYPALFLSKFSPMRVIRDNKNSGGKNASLRRFLLVFQFALSSIMIIGTWITMNQFDFLRSKNPGFQKENVLLIPLRDDQSRKNREILINSIKSVPGVLNVASSSRIPGWGTPSNDKIPEGFSRETTQLMDEINVDENFIPTLGMQIIAGRNFSNKFSDNKNSVIINETAVKQFNWKNPIGKNIQMIDPYQSGKLVSKKVIGVIKDYHQRPLSQAIKPLFVGNDPDFPFGYNFLRMISVRIKPGKISELISHLDEKWQKINGHREFDYYFLDESFDRQFRDVENSRQLLSYFTVLAIIIACLGLFGLAAYSAEQRMKEIGIRKVLGASVTQIVLLLTRDFSFWILLSNIISFPIAYFVMQNWLLNFAYKTSIGLNVFVLTALSTLLLGMLTVSFQALRSAYANPVNSLQSES